MTSKDLSLLMDDLKSIAAYIHQLEASVAQLPLLMNAALSAENPQQIVNVHADNSVISNVIAGLEMCDQYLVNALLKLQIYLYESTED